MRIGLVGVGNHARRNLLPAIEEASTTSLAAICTRNESVRASTADQYGCRAYATLDELLGDDQIEAVVLATPTGVHADDIDSCLQAGKHVLCEKSLTHEPVRSAELVEAAERAGLLLAEMFMFVHHPQWQALEHLIRSEQLGAMRSVTARFGFPHLPPEDIRNQRHLGGGALLDVGAYTIAAARRLLGEATSTWSHLETQAGHSVDTDGSALVRSPYGAHAQLSWGFGRSYRNEVEVWCEKGTVRAERVFSKPASLGTTLRVQHQEGNRVEDIEIAPANHFVRMLDTLCGAASQGQSAEWTREARQQAQWLEQMRGTP